MKLVIQIFFLCLLSARPASDIAERIVNIRLLPLPSLLEHITKANRLILLGQITSTAMPSLSYTPGSDQKLSFSVDFAALTSTFPASKNSRREASAKAVSMYNEIISKKAAALYLQARLAELEKRKPALIDFNSILALEDSQRSIERDIIEAYYSLIALQCDLYLLCAVPFDCSKLSPPLSFSQIQKILTHLTPGASNE